MERGGGGRGEGANAMRLVSQSTSPHSAAQLIEPEGQNWADEMFNEFTLFWLG